MSYNLTGVMGTGPTAGVSTAIGAKALTGTTGVAAGYNLAVGVDLNVTSYQKSYSYDNPPVGLVRKP